MRSRLFSLLKSIFEQFWTYLGMFFWMFCGGRRTVHVDNATPENSGIFQRNLNGTRVLALPTNFGKSRRSSTKKLIKSHEKRGQNERPCPTPLWKAFGQFWLYFWSHLASDIVPETILKGNRRVGAPSGANGRASPLYELATRSRICGNLILKSILHSSERWSFTAKQVQTKPETVTGS